MEWTDRFNKAINYIEEHITDDIDYDHLAGLACCSSYHFQRMFSYIANVPLSEYIRRRRMSLAAVDLQFGEKVVDVAIKYGYSSPTAFNRAFQSIHGIAPSLVRDQCTSLKSFPPISFQLTIKGAEEMNYRIETKEAFRIVGISRPLFKEVEKNFEIVPQMWQTAAMDGTIPRLTGIMNGNPMGLLGVSACCGDDQWKYFIAVTNDSTLPEGLEEYIVPPFTWAVFPGESDNPKAIQKLEQQIIMDWLPTSGYEFGSGPDIEVYISPDPQHAIFEVWIPVVKK